MLSVTLSVSMTVACQRKIGQSEPSHNDVMETCWKDPPLFIFLSFYFLESIIGQTALLRRINYFQNKYVYRKKACCKNDKIYSIKRSLVDLYISLLIK